MEKINYYPFNGVRYVTLFKKEEQLIGKDQKLSMSEFVELQSYVSQLENYVLFKTRSQLVFLIETFLNGTVDADEFSEDFSRLTDEQPELKDLFLNPSLEIVKDLEIGPEHAFSHFARLKDNIRVGCFLFDQDDEDFPEENLRNLVKEQYAMFLKYDDSIDVTMEEYFELAPATSKSKDDEVLISVMIFFTITTLMVYNFIIG